MPPPSQDKLCKSDIFVLMLAVDSSCPPKGRSMCGGLIHLYTQPPPILNFFLRVATAMRIAKASQYEAPPQRVG